MSSKWGVYLHGYNYYAADGDSGYLQGYLYMVVVGGGAVMIKDPLLIE